MKQINLKECLVTEAMTQIDTWEGITPKVRGCLRLLTEEMFSLVKELLELTAADFEIRQEDSQYALTISTNTRINLDTREELLSLSTSGKNAANKGFKGILGAVLESFLIEGDSSLYTPAFTYGLVGGSEEYAYLWTYSRYMEYVPQEESRKNWDGMEKSIIACFADDVAIAVRSGRLEMTVTKAV